MAFVFIFNINGKDFLVKIDEPQDQGKVNTQNNIFRGLIMPILRKIVLMVNVSGKNYIVETEDDPDLTSENDGRMSKGKGCLKA